MNAIVLVVWNEYGGHKEQRLKAIEAFTLDI